MDKTRKKLTLTKVGANSVDRVWIRTKLVTANIGDCGSLREIAYNTQSWPCNPHGQGTIQPELFLELERLN
jgi:hypothetical protein